MTAMIEKFENQIKEKTDNELSAIYLNSKDYQLEFIKLVEQELNNRKIPIESLKFIKNEKDKIEDDTLLLGIQGNPYWIMAGFISCLAGGVAGIVTGYIYAYSKHKNAKGDDYFYYNESTRKYGTWMFIIGCSVLGLILMIKLSKQ